MQIVTYPSAVNRSLLMSITSVNCNNWLIEAFCKPFFFLGGSLINYDNAVLFTAIHCGEETWFCYTAPNLCTSGIVPSPNTANFIVLTISSDLATPHLYIEVYRGTLAVIFGSSGDDGLLNGSYIYINLNKFHSLNNIPPHQYIA